MRSSGIVVFGGVCLLLSAALNVALAFRVAEQREVIETGGGERQEMVGRRMEPLVGTDPSGVPARVEFGSDGKPTVLYVFAPGCGWCDRNYEAVIALQEGVASARDIDLAVVAGTGFPNEKGGPLHLADQLGIDEVLRQLDKFTESVGIRFWPAPMLRRLVDAGFTGQLAGRGFFPY